MPQLELTFASGEDSLSVRRFVVQESISSLFTVSIWARSPSAFLDLEAFVGKPASFAVVSGIESALRHARKWTGVCSFVEQVAAEPTGLSTYHLRIVPELWLLTHRRNHRIFQHAAIPDIADTLLREWGLAYTWRIDRGAYPKLAFKVQYGESDFSFLCRLFEEAGIAFTFPDDGEGSKLCLGDKLHAAEPRRVPLPFLASPDEVADKEFVTDVRLAHEVRPGAYVIRDHDFRNPSFALVGAAPKVEGLEARYEQFQYQPGAFSVDAGPAGSVSDPAYGSALAERALLGMRSDRRHVNFSTNALDVGAGVVYGMSGHPHAELSESNKLLVTDYSFEGAPAENWSMSGLAVFAKEPYRPALRTPKPDVAAVQSATVVGPAGHEIHTDEFGRVRVQFPWDREGRSDDGSSCWMRVSQGWAGVGYGMITIPRVGQEVLVAFVGGDPDRPLVVGRVYNNTQRVPYKLPEHKTRSTWKSSSSPGAGGFNELMFEDLAGNELVYLQAQKNLRKLVKNDETITVGHDRQKLVMHDETETTGANRTEMTGANRTELTGRNRTTVVLGDESKLVKGTETERTEGDLVLRVAGEQHILIQQVKRERIEKDSHLHVVGDRNEQVDKTKSLTAGALQIKVGTKHGLHAGKEIHIQAGTALVIEATHDLTFKGPGGFVRIDARGITIKGKKVKINSGGLPGSGSGANPTAPEAPTEAQVVQPAAPVPDDIFKTGLAQ